MSANIIILPLKYVIFWLGIEYQVERNFHPAVYKYWSIFFQFLVLLLRSSMLLKFSTLCTEYFFSLWKLSGAFLQSLCSKFQSYVLNVGLFAFTALDYQQLLFCCFFSSVLSVIVDYYFFYSITAILVTFWREQSINMQIQSAIWIQIFQRLPYETVPNNSYVQVC